MSSPALTEQDYKHVEKLVEEGKYKEILNWIVAHEAIAQTVLLEYYHKIS